MEFKLIFFLLEKMEFKLNKTVHNSIDKFKVCCSPASTSQTQPTQPTSQPQSQIQPQIHQQPTGSSAVTFSRNDAEAILPPPGVCGLQYDERIIGGEETALKVSFLIFFDILFMTFVLSHVQGIPLDGFTKIQYTYVELTVRKRIFIKKLLYL